MQSGEIIHNFTESAYFQDLLEVATVYFPVSFIADSSVVVILGIRKRIEACALRERQICRKAGTQSLKARGGARLNNYR
jgi:hypothetical protein